MPITATPPQPELLSDAQAAGPGTRLAQAVARADFLLRLSRTLATIQSPDRALAAVVDLVVGELVDAAAVSVRTGTLELACAGVRGQAPVSRRLRLVDAGHTHDRVLEIGLPETVALSPEPGKRLEELAAHLGDARVAEQAQESGPSTLVLLPLVVRGRTVGLLTLVGRTTLGTSVDFLDDLTARVAMGLDATLVLAESRHVAAVLRQSLAPEALPEVPHLDVDAFYRVAHQSEALGGDVVDVHGPDDDLVLLCGDVSGKGVSAAVHAKRIRNACRTARHIRREPGWILGLVNQVLCSEADPFSESLATAVCARLRPDHGRLRVDIASAGHPPALVVRSDGRVEEVDASGPSLALLEGSEYAESTLHLLPGETVVFYTDGVTEAHGSADLFGDQRLRHLLGTLAGLSAHAVTEAVAVAVSDHLGDRPHDDIALLAVRYLPQDSA